MVTKPECRWGYTLEQLNDLLSEDFPNLLNWLGEAKRTVMLCQGRTYDCDEKEQCSLPHGPVVFTADFEEYLAETRDFAHFNDSFTEEELDIMEEATLILEDMELSYEELLGLAAGMVSRAMMSDPSFRDKLITGIMEARSSYKDTKDE